MPRNATALVVDLSGRANSTDAKVAAVAGFEYHVGVCEQLRACSRTASPQGCANGDVDDAPDALKSDGPSCVSEDIQVSKPVPSAIASA